MQYHDLYQHLQSQQRFGDQFKDVPKRSPATSIAASYAAWNKHGPSILSAFKRIRDLAKKVRHTEYRWVRSVSRELQAELDQIQLKLSECALGSPPEEQSLR
jgi:hypothetical protein